MVALAFVALLPLFSTSRYMLVRGLLRLGLPYSAGLTVMLALRYIPTFLNLFAAIRQAQEARGWLPQGRLLARLRAFLPVLVAMVIASLRTADQLAMAMAVRGLNANPTHRTAWRDIQMRPWDWLAAGLKGLAIAVFLQTCRCI